LKKSRSPKSARSPLLVLFQRQARDIVAFEVRGHAGFGPAGSDVVCAAVSALVLASAEGLKRHCAAKPLVLDSAERYQLELPQGGGAAAQAVLKTMLTGLRAVGRAYPGYMRIRHARLVPTGCSPRPQKRRSRAA